MDDKKTKKRMNDAFEQAAKVAESMLRHGKPEDIPATIRAMKIEPEPVKTKPPIVLKKNLTPGKERDKKPWSEKQADKNLVEATDTWGKLMNGRSFA